MSVGVASSSFTRPNDAAVYASGDLVANSTSPGSVTPLSFTTGGVNGLAVQVRRVRLSKSSTTVTLATFRLHLFSTNPAPPTNGDNGALATARSGYAGYIDLDMTAASARTFSDGVEVIGVPAIGSEITIRSADGSNAIYGLLEARAAYTPTANEVFTVEIETQVPGRN